jgi:ABC-type multidrug transport system fused ATPase/permease subunit
LILLSLPVYERIYVFPAYSRFNVADNYDYFFIFADRKCRGVFRPVTKSSMQQSNYIIEVKNVSKFFGDKIALDNINLYVKKGEFVTILQDVERLHFCALLPVFRLLRKEKSE